MTQYAPCDWPVDYGTECTVLAGTEMELSKAKFEQMAVELLWNWTNRIFGTCDVTIRPCRSKNNFLPSTWEGRGPVVNYPAFSGGWYPELINGEWFNLYCGRCGVQNCTCEYSLIKSIHLPGPVVEVTEVTIDGVVLAAGNYRLDNSRWLVRTDGEAWPAEQNLDVDSSAVGSWTVSYTQGVETPIGGQIAAGRLACELAKAHLGDKSCGLPQRVQSITRQGVTVGAMMDTFEDLKDGKTGIWEIDAWTGSVIRPREFASVVSVDNRGGNSWRH